MRGRTGEEGALSRAASAELFDRRPDLLEIASSGSRRAAAVRESA